MNCHEVRQNVFTYMDGYLSAPQEQSLYLHLSGCGHCQEEMGQARQLNRILESACIPVDPPANFVGAIMSHLALVDMPASVAVPLISALPTGSVSGLHRQDTPQARGRRWTAVLSRWETRSLLVASCLALFLMYGQVLIPRAQVVERVPVPVDLTGTQVVINSSPQQGTSGNQILGTTGTQGKPDTTAAVPGNGKDISITDSSPAQVTEPATPSVPVVGSDANPGGKGTEQPVSGIQSPQPGTLEILTPPGGEVQIARSVPEGNVQVVPLVVDPLVSSVKPVWSPDFKEIWFLSQKEAQAGSYIPWKVNSDGTGTQARLFSQQGNSLLLGNGGGVWSPGRDRLAYIEEKDGYMQLMVNDLKGHVTSLTPDLTGEVEKQRQAGNPISYWAYWPVWSPQGELVYLTTRNGNLDIMRVDGNGSNLAVTKTPGQEMYPVWSPDGGMLAFYRSWADGSGNRVDSVFVTDRNGEKERQIATATGADSLVPAWSPDGQRLAVNVGFTEPRPGMRQRGLWLVNADGTGLVVVSNQGGGRLVSWSPDGKKVAFNDHAGRLYVLVLADQQDQNEVLTVTSVTDIGGMNVTWSRDSSQLLFDQVNPGTTTRGISVAILPQAGR